MSTDPAHDVPVANVPDRSRYEITVDGETAGFTAYLDHDGHRIFYHTVVEERFAGRGLAGQLVSAALTATREAGLRVVAVCPYVKKYTGSHHEFDDILDPVGDDDLAAARAALQEQR